VTTLIAGSSLAGMSPAMTVEGGTTAAVFVAYLEQVLLPALRPGRVMVDDVGAHEPDRMRALVEAAGCRLVLLPAYYPDLSPVEAAVGAGRWSRQLEHAPGRRRTPPSL
jgi:transposase